MKLKDKVILLSDNLCYHVSTFIVSTMEVERIDGTVMCLDGEMDISMEVHV